MHMNEQQQVDDQVSVPVVDEKALGKAIQDARRTAGMTQQELCQKTHISYSTLAKIERGAIKSPSVFTVAQIAGLCKVSIESLLGSSAPGFTSNAIPRTLYKTAKNGIRFVYFDINGCLVRFFQRAFSDIAVETGASPELIENTFWHYNDAVCRGEMTMKEFNQVLGDKIGKKDLDWSDYYLSSVDPILEMHDCVRWAAEHYPVGLLTNIMPGLVDQMLEKGLLPKVPYLAIIDSSLVGAIKPEPEIYSIAGARADVLPDDILLIDDSRANLMAAQHAGWHVLWFDDFRPSESITKIKQILEF
jgi:FMN phosphatase YigB (HAD superfamily)/DNA-binding XRE family transcriptional regulator